MSTYNLLREPWIPVRRRSGKFEWVAPWQIAETDDPPTHIETGRPDFDGSLTQFLIGLVQTAATPKSDKEWRAQFKAPPSPERLRAAFEVYADAFNLDGPGPRFMQDFELDEAKAPKKDVHEVGELFIDIPSHFIKEGRVEALELASAAAALYTLQANAPSGGAGNRTSLRGGGPLTTLVVGESLWQSVWLNVLTEQGLRLVPGDRSRAAVSDIFPWMGPTRVATAGDTTPEHVHPLQHFWGMPRRIRFVFSEGGFVCSVSKRAATRAVERYYARPQGVNYVGAFSHPLTPYSLLSPGQPPNPKKGDPITYRDWPMFVTGRKTGKVERIPALTVRWFYEDMRDEALQEPRLWAFGYEMENMKPVCWHSGMTPLFRVSRQRREAFRSLVSGCVAVSESVCDDLVGQSKNALLRRPGDARGDLGFLKEQLWSRTEPEFFATLTALRDGLEADGEAPAEALEGWLATLHRTAMQLFRESSQMAASLDAADLKRVALAHEALSRSTRPTNKRLRALLDLPEKPATASA
ncbi:MAG: type I-E CRISPR-associated protein Cse1/CasA [Myxococcales bacterium]|jgi:CRISPR system Cascade subunit CasA